MFQMLSTMIPPPFDETFIMSVQVLDMYTQMTPRQQRDIFLRFLNDYGTHFVTDMVLGAKVLRTQKYSKHTTQSIGRATLEECTKKWREGNIYRRHDIRAYWSAD